MEITTKKIVEESKNWDFEYIKEMWVDFPDLNSILVEGGKVIIINDDVIAIYYSLKSWSNGDEPEEMVSRV